MVILWVVQVVAAGFVVALGFASVALPLSRISVQVDPATLPPGTTYVVIFSSTGPVSRVSCPPPFSGEEAPSYCVDAVRGGRWWFLASVLGWAASVALFILVRRGRITVRDRRRAWSAIRIRPRPSANLGCRRSGGCPSHPWARWRC